MALIALLLVLGVLLAAAALLPQGAPASVLVAAAGVPVANRPLLIRFIDRSRRFRRAGAIASFVVGAAVAVAVVADRDGGGLGSHVGFVVLASIGLGGSILGSVAAEAFRLRRSSGPRVASLTVRDPASYRDRLAERRERALIGFSVLAVVLSPAVDDALARTVSLFGAILLLAVLRRWVTARVALRARPALPRHLEVADDRVRSLAISAGLSRPIVTLAALLGSTQWAALAVHTPSERVVEQLVNLAGVIGSIGLLGVAVVWWWQNRSFGLAPAGAGSGEVRRLAWGRVAAVLAVLLLLLAVVVGRGG